MLILQDTLMGFKYQGAVFSAVPKTQGLGVFLELDIGQGYAFAQEAGKREYMMFRGHGVWKDSHVFTEKDIPDAIKRAAQFNKIAAQFPKTRWYYSPWCEHAASSTLAKKVLDASREAAPHCRIVNCPLPKGAVVPGYITESHGGYPRSSFHAYSCDGVTPPSRSQLKSLELDNAGGEYFGAWRCQYNGKSFDKQIIPRSERTDWATVAQIKQLVSWV